MNTTCITMIWWFGFIKKKKKKRWFGLHNELHTPFVASKHEKKFATSIVWKNQFTRTREMKPLIWHVKGWYYSHDQLKKHPTLWRFVTMAIVNITSQSIDEPQKQQCPLSYKKNACYRKHESIHNNLLPNQPVDPHFQMMFSTSKMVSTPLLPNQKKKKTKNTCWINLFCLFLIISRIVRNNKKTKIKKCGEGSNLEILRSSSWDTP